MYSPGKWTNPQTRLTYTCIPVQHSHLLEYNFPCRCSVKCFPGHHVSNFLLPHSCNPHKHSCRHTTDVYGFIDNHMDYIAVCTSFLLLVYIIFLWFYRSLRNELKKYECRSIRLKLHMFTCAYPDPSAPCCITYMMRSLLNFPILHL